MTIEEILEKTNHIPSSVYAEEQTLWLKYLKDLPEHPLIIDFGTGWGKSAVSLGLACPQGMVLTFDTGTVYVLHDNVKNLNEYALQVEENIRKSGVANVQHFLKSSIEGNPQEFVIKFGKKTGIDVLNIDSDHDYEITKKEMRAWMPLVKTGGIIMFHDYEHPMCPGVGEAIHELCHYQDDNGKLYTGTEFNLELIDKARNPKVTTAIFRKLV